MEIREDHWQPQGRTTTAGGWTTRVWAWADWPNGHIGRWRLYIPPDLAHLRVWRRWETILESCYSILELLPHMVIKYHLVITADSLQSAQAS